ncbi:F-actin-monooxygenase mical2b [Lampris incognitus]|uniref:F-actin-monooxygenase mical2b n=1 Tax=Lampris incognitus TaxID=2546036 RepID=UPI0024B4A6E6|nr:F-actin-monooxygenase mical2b [Lampris incognitus]
MGETEDESTAQASQLFENFVQASTCKGTLQAFSILCRQMDLDPLDYRNFYSSLKSAISSWKVKALWTKLDKRAGNKVYNHGEACQGTRCLIIGGGPCGLRTAIELALLGCQVLVIEKRDTFSRNNVLHLWPYTIHDLKGLGAKKFYGKFCAGSIDHISIRQLQLMLLKVCLIVGVTVHVNVEFLGLLEPPEERSDDGPGWRAAVRPSKHPVSDFDFDVIIGADGRRSTLDGFSRKEFRGKLAIAITANFVNRNTTAEAKVEEISGVAFIFNQKFFLELKEETGIDLENIVYYKDNTHYFVMTAKKQSLLEKGVIINDFIETERLLSSDNVNQEALLSYAREAADFGTNYQLPSLDYAINHYGQPDVAMFDFTSMYASENAALIRQKHGHQLLVTLVGDSLLEPFWPMGTGCARGFLAAFDTAWMVRGWAQGKSPQEILAERESIYRLLPQTTTENISKNFEQYSIDPTTRYPNLNSSCVRPHQVRHLFIDGQQDSSSLERGGPTRRSVNLSRRESDVRPSRLLTWCQKQTQGYRGVEVIDLTSSWRNGLALCALIHRQRPELIDYDSLNEGDVAGNNQLAFDVAEREFGIQPVTTGKEVAMQPEPDKLLMVLYLSKFYEAFRNSPGNNNSSREPDENSEVYSSKSNPNLLTQPRKRIPKDDKKLEDIDSANKRRRKSAHYLAELSCRSVPPTGEAGELRENKVRSMATQLLAKFEENSSTAVMHNKVRDPPSPDLTPPPSPFPEGEEEEEEEEERENPRFAKPKVLPPPPPPPRPKWQPSVYLRLLENPASVAQPISPLYSSQSPSPLNSFSQSHPPSPSRSMSLRSPSRSPSPNVADHGSGCPSPQPPTSPFSEKQAETINQTHSHGGLLSFRDESQKVPTEEFKRMTIKDRAVTIASMFSSSNKVSVPAAVTPLQSQSSAVHPVIHPLPEPAAQACFSSHTLANTDKSQRVPSPSISDSDSEKTEKISSLHLASPLCNNQTSSCKISLPLSAVNCENGDESSSSPPASQLHKDSCQMTDGSAQENIQCSGSSAVENLRRITGKPAVQSKSCPSGAAKYSKERTVGKVSSAIDAKAQTLAILYETDHRPNATLCVVRKDFPAGLGGSDTCHFCSKRVYVMERLSAEGFFFHRECFRCNVCGCTLRLGGHTFDSHQGKFYCKAHYAQLQSSTHLGKFGRRTGDQRRITSLPLDNGGYTVPGSLQIQPAGVTGHVRLSKKKQIADKPLEPSCKSKTAAVDMTMTQDQEDDGTTEDVKPSLPDKNSRWKRKIRSTFPLIFVKHFQRRRPEDREKPETVHEVDSDSEGFSAKDKPVSHDNAKSSGEIKNPSKSEKHKVQSANIEARCDSSSPKKRLLLSQSEKDRLLDWDLSASSEEIPGQNNVETKSTQQPKDQGQAETQADKTQTGSGKNAEPTQSQTSTSSPSAFQLIANAFRRSFGGASPSSNSTTAVTMRTKPDGPCKLRPKSEGEFSFNSMFGSVPPESWEKEEKPRKPHLHPLWSSVGTDSWRSGQDLPSLLQQVSLGSRRGSGGVFSDDMASLPCKRVNFFSSLRLRRSKVSESDCGDKEGQEYIRTILTKFRNKASSQQKLEDPLSSEEENENVSANQKVCLERQRRKQENMVAQQAKREQMKRLHRAQAIQRQLEEVGEKQRDVEERGVAIERMLRGETDESQSDGGEEAQLYQSWFKLVLEKNRLARYESELMIFTQELQLEDTQSQLQHDLRPRMAIDDSKKSASELQEEQEVLAEIMRTVERRDMLVSLLEEQRLQERAEDKDLESLVLSRGYEFHWTRGHDWGSES